MKRFSMLLLTAVVALSLSTTVVRAAEEPVQVLVLDGLKIDARLTSELEKEGIHFTYGNIEQPISEEMLRQFHVVIINQNQIAINFQNPVPYFNSKETYARLVAYVQAGGSVYFGGPVLGLTPSFGVETRELAVRDDPHMWTEAVTGTGLRAEFAWTTAIAKHPTTKGVTRIVYPVVQGRWDDMYATPAFTWSKEWRPVVSSMKSGTISRGSLAGKWEVIEKKPSALAAVRPFGEGRAAFVAINPFYTMFNPYDPPTVSGLAEFFVGRLDGVFIEKGDGKKFSSQGRVLVGNLLRWLAESSRAHGFGTHTPESYAKLVKPASAPVPLWIGQNGWMGWSPTRGGTWRQVLIGARTAYSDGQGTVAEYAAAARKQGLAVLGITETMEKFNPANWDRFKEECRKECDDTLTVVHGLDLADRYGNRFIVLNNDAFPPSSWTSTGSQIMSETQYLGYRMGTDAVTIAHRLTTSPLVHQLVKHWQGISVYTYRHGQLEDNSFPAYEWQIYRYSNPVPLVIHETYSPADLELEAKTGHQLTVYTATAREAGWYLVGSHGSSHFWETPTKLQISNGPRLEAFNDRPFLRVVSDVPIKEVRLMENYNLYRRWTPGTNDFTVESVVLPKAHWAWMFLVATDVKGRTVVSPPLCAGLAGSFAWRCGDRQNWLAGGPDIYPGWLDADSAFAVPVFGTDEGSPSYFGYPDMHGPQRGDNMCPILDFPFTSPMAQIQDVFIDERYYRATWDDIAGDARPAHVTSRARVFAAQMRYVQFFEGKTELPRLKFATVRLRRPVDATAVGDIFPVFTGLRTQWVDSGGDLSYAYTDPKTGQPVTGKLSAGFLDLPRGGRVGGFIALSDGIRVGVDGRVGFAPRSTAGGALPIDSIWEARFTTVPLDKAEEWRQRMGLTATTPYQLQLTQGVLSNLAYVAECQAANGGIAGTVTKAIPDIYRLPVRVRGVNYNWDAALWRPGQELVSVDVFEGNAWARLDVTKPGEFYIGNIALADDLNLRLGVREWTAQKWDVDVHNPTDRAITAKIWTCPLIPGRYAGAAQLTVPPGTSTNVVVQVPVK